ncbi:DUF4031 domain-containing protein [Microbacterium enclense]|uniref:DUF4031 domain-containing protein n=1 Tax=Microbacterium enclense TaxID=993073 RepID=UPI003F7F21D7
MTVYVDDAFIEASVHNGARMVSGRWCHMTADTRAELDAMADRIGLRRHWIQHPGTPKEHYDVTEPKRKAAVIAGAREVGAKDRIRQMMRQLPATSSVTTVVNRRSHSFDVYIGRGSDWGNPFIIGEHGSRADVIHRFELHLRSRPDLLVRLPELRGKRLGCYCAPRACHGDVLARYIEMPPADLSDMLARGAVLSPAPVAKPRSSRRRARVAQANDPPRSFVAVDFETCMAKRCSPIQIGVVRFDDGVQGPTFTSPVLPPVGFRFFERGAQRVHGLGPAYVLGAPEWPEIHERLVRFAAGPDGSLLPLVAHNASFERSVISQTSKVCGFDGAPFEFFDTVTYAQKVLPDAPNHRLDTLVELLSLSDDFRHHDAGEDAAATARLLLCLSDRVGACA